MRAKNANKYMLYITNIPEKYKLVHFLRCIDHSDIIWVNSVWSIAILELSDIK